MRRVALLGMLTACGRIGFEAPAGDAWSGGDSTIDGAPAFVQFPGDGTGRTLSRIGAGDDFVLGGSVDAVVDFGGGPLAYSGGRDGFLASYTADGAHRWSRAIGGPGEDAVLRITADEAGNIYVVGSFSGTVNFGGGVMSSSGTTDGFIASYDASGGYRWAQRMGSAVATTDSFHAVAARADWVYAVGLSSGTADAGGPAFACAAVNQMIVIAAYDTDGGHRWSRCYGTGPWNSARGVAVDGAGNVTIHGYYDGTTDLGGGLLPDGGGLDLFLASYDRDGGHRWSRGFTGATDDWGNGVAADDAGNVVATGFFSGTVDFGGGPLTATGQTDGYIIGFTPAGAHAWSRRFGGSDCDTGRGVYIAGSEAYVTGELDGTTDFGGPSITSTGMDGFFTRLDVVDGAHRDTVRLGDGLDDEAWAALPIPGSVLVTGRVDVTSTSACPNAGGSSDGEIFLRRL